MKNKILIGVAILLILIVIWVRYEFKEKFEVFKTSISKNETTQLEDFRRKKVTRVASLSYRNKKLYQLFIDQFDEKKSISERDTSFSFLYLSGSVKYKVASLKYIDCLNSKCIIDQQNEESQKLIASKETELSKKYGETFSLWYPKLKDSKILQKVNKSGECSNYFPDLNEVSYDADKWNDFEKFMIAYNFETKESEIQNKQTEYLFASSVASAKSQLRNGVMDYFDEKLSNRKLQILTTKTETKEFKSTSLGVIDYSVYKTTFDKQAFQNVADDAFEEQWKFNSLSTGAMPYSYCYGSTNYCDYGCSKISVRTGSSDVLVTIKDLSGDVVRHAYIASGNTFTFNISDGQYQVFFYSGTGWNPKKYMTTNSCGTLLGGFVSGERFSKDNFISLYSQRMSYELILQQNGNLNTEPSSINEAFK